MTIINIKQWFDLKGDHKKFLYDILNDLGKEKKQVYRLREP